MAFLALGRSVHAYQGKAGQVMIEKDFFVPAPFIMAVIALFALFAQVNIVFPVARDAVGFHLVLVNFALVTERTGKVLVFAAKREIGLLVVVKRMLAP